MKLILTIIALAFVMPACVSAESTALPFTDIPKDHWASEAVASVSKAGIMKGYADSKFKGDKCVTRYELAAALAGLAQFFQESRKPLLDKSESMPKKEAEKAKADPVKWLIENKYLPANTILKKDPNKPVSESEVAAGAASVIARACELDVKSNPLKPLPTEKDWQ